MLCHQLENSDAQYLRRGSLSFLNGFWASCASYPATVGLRKLLCEKKNDLAGQNFHLVLALLVSSIFGTV